ncbi:hypothetical protein CRG98_046567, partial [Punica granatum]
MLTRASLLLCFASSPSQLARASFDLAGSAHLCEFTFMLRKFAETAGSFFLRPCRVCSLVRVYFHATQVRGACALVLLTTLPGRLTCASLLSCFVSSPRLLARSSCDLAGSAHSCEFTFTLRKYAEPARSCFLQPCRAGSPVRVYFHASTRSLRARASYNLAGPAHLCEFTFMLRKFAETAGSFFLRPCRVCSLVRVYFHATQVRGACALVLLTTLPGRLTCASLLSCFVSSPRLLARSSCDLAGSAHSCEFTFTLRKYAEPARSCFLQPCRAGSPVRVYFHASQVREVCLLVLLSTLLGLLTRATLRSFFQSSLRRLARSSCDLAGSAHPCESTFTLCKYVEPARSCFLHPCRVCSPVRVYFHASQVRRACSVVLLATWPDIHTRASLFSCFASSPSLLGRASCDLDRYAHPREFTFVLRKFAESARSFYFRPCWVCSPVRVYFHNSTRSLLARASCTLVESAHPCEFTFTLRKYAEPARSCFLHPCRVCSPVRVYFHASQVRGACSLVLLAPLSSLLTRASLLSRFASTRSLLARASCTLVESAHPCEFTFTLRKYAEPARSCFLHPCRVCSPVRVYFHASQVRGACSLVLLAPLSSLLTRASLLSRFASTRSLLARASCTLVESAHPCEFTFTLRKYAEPARSCFLHPCRVCSPVRVYFHASQVRGACSLVLLAPLSSLLTRASLLSRFASTRSLLARASCTLVESAHPCEFTFTLRKYAEPARSCFLHPCRVCSPVRVYFHASQVRGACSLVLLAPLSSLLTRASLLSRFASTRSLLARASCTLVESAHPCEFTFTLRKYAEPARSCFLHPCRVCAPVRVYFHASQVRRAYLVVLLATLPGLLTRTSLLSCFASFPRLLARSSCDLDGSAHPCECTITIRKYAEPARSCFLQPRRNCSPVRVYFQASQVRRACSVVLLATRPNMLTRTSLHLCYECSPSQLARASFDHARSAHPCEFTFMLRKFAETAGSFFLRPCRVSSPVRAYFHASQVRGASSLMLLTTLPGLLTRASLLSYFESSPRLRARSSCDLAWLAHPYEFTFTLGKYAKPARSCFLQPCRVGSPVRVYFHASQGRRACSVVLLATWPDMHTRASLLSCFATSPSLLGRASCDLARYAHPCEFTFMLRKFAEPARSCFLRPGTICTPVRVYFLTSQVCRACWLVLLSTLLGLLTRTNLPSCLASSPSLLGRASCNLTGSAHRCEFTFMQRKFAEAARTCFMQTCRVCSPVRVYFHASQVRRACLVVLLANLPALLTRASLLSCYASSRSLLTRASFDLAGSPHPCDFAFMLRKFIGTAGSFFLRPCRVCSPIGVYFHASNVRGAYSVVLPKTLLGLLTRTNLRSCHASSPSLLACACCDLAESAHPCEFTFMLPKFAEPARSCFLQPCRVGSPVRVYFLTSQVCRACWLVLLSTLLGLLTRTNLRSCHASSPSLLARASCTLVESAHPCEFTFMLPKFAEPARSCLLTRASLLSQFASTQSLLARASCTITESAHSCECTFMLRKFAEPTWSCYLRPCRVCSPVRAYYHDSQPDMLTRASLLSCYASSPSQLARASFDLAGSSHRCEFTFILRKFAEFAGSLFLQPCRVCSPVRVYFHASQVRRACWLVLLATLPGLLTCASLLSCFASSSSLLARSSCDLAGSAHLCEFTFMLRKFVEPAGSFFLRPCRVCSPVRVYFHASQVRRACWLVLLATLPGLLTCASLLSCFASSSSLLGRVSCDLARYAHPREFTFVLRKFAESARSCFFRPCWVFSPVRVYFHTSSLRLRARSSCHLARSAHPCEFTFTLRKYAEPARSCFLHPCQVCSPVRVDFHALQVRRAYLVVLLATLPGLLTRTSLLSCFASSTKLLARSSCDLDGSAHLCEFTITIRKYAEPARSCILQPCRVCSFVWVYIHASQVRRACSVVLLATWPDMLTRASLHSCYASSPRQLARASFDFPGSAHPCEFTFMLRKFAETAGSFFLRPCRVSSPVRVYFHASQVRGACSLVLLATLPGLLTCASLLSRFASTRSLLARASCNLAGSAHLCEFTFTLRKYAEPARSCFLQPCRVCSPVRVYFHASQVRRACSVVLLATWPDMLTRASLHSCYASSPRQLARASFDFPGSAHPCEFTFMLRKFAETAGSFFLRPCRVSSPVRVYFHASQPRLRARSSCDLAWSAHPCEFTFTLRKYAEPARSCFLQPCRVCSPLRVYFHSSQVSRDCGLVLLATLPGQLTRASLLSRFASTRSLLAHASYNLAGFVHPCEFTFILRKLAEIAGSFFLRPCLVSSPVRVYFHARQPGLLTRASLLSRFASTRSLLAHASYNLAGFVHPCEFTFILRKLAEIAGSFFLRPCLVSSPVRVYFHARQVRRACSVVLLSTLPDIHTRASLLSGFASSPSLLTRASCDLARSAHPYECTFMPRKFAEPARSCFLQPCRVCSPLRVDFHATLVRRAYSLVLLATLPILLTRASLPSCFASSPRLLGRATCNHAGSAHPCEFTFMLCKFARTAGSFFLRHYRVCSPVRVYFHASQVRGACSLLLLTTLPNLPTRTSLHSYFASSPRLRARSSCDLVGSAHPCEFTFTLRKYAELARSCFLQPCWVCSPVRVYFHASQVRRVGWLVVLATMSRLLTRASSLSCFASLPSLLAHASCDLVGFVSSQSRQTRASGDLVVSAHSCEFTFMLCKFAEPAGSCFLQPCRVCLPVLVYLNASQVRRAYSLVLLATLPGLLTRFTFLLRKFAEPTRSCFLRPSRVCSPVRVYFHASQVRRACFLVLLETLLGLLTRASLISRFASTRSLLARASCNLGRSAHLCGFTFMLHKFAEPARSCFLRPQPICTLVQVYFLASQVRGACSLVLLATLSGLLTRASLLSRFASTRSLLARASCNLVGSAHPCEFTFMLRKFAERAGSCFWRPCRVCSPVRVHFHALQVCRAYWLMLLATLPGPLTRASLLSCFPGSPSQLARVSYDLAGSAHPCEFTFRLRKFTEPAGSFFMSPYRVCSHVRVYFHASQPRGAYSLVLLATLPGLFSRVSLLSCFARSQSRQARSSGDLVVSAHPCEFTFMLCKFAEPAGSCFFSSSLLGRASCDLAESAHPCECDLAGSAHPCEFHFHASQVRRAYLVVLLATLPGLLSRASLLSRFATPRSLLARASCDLARSAHPCEFHFHASQVRRAYLVVLLATLPGLLSRASLLSRFATPRSLLARASCDLARSAHPCEFHFHASQVRRAYLVVLLATLPGLLSRASLLSRFATPRSLLARASCDLARSAHPCEFHFHASQVRRAYLVVLLATLPGLLSRASLLSRFATPRSLLARASCDLARSAHPCEFHFHASQVRRAYLVVLLATLPGLLSRASLLSRFATPRSLLARASCDLARSAHPCEFHFHASQVRRAYLVVLLATLPGLLSRASLLSRFATPRSLLARASCDLARSAHPCEFHFHASQVRRAYLVVLLATLPGLLSRASLLSRFATPRSLLARASCDLARSAHPCEFHFHASQVRRAYLVVLLATLPGLLSRASLLSRFATPRSLLARASCDLARSAHPCEFHFHASQVRRAYLVVLLATLPGLLSRASLLSRFATPRSLLARASCDLARSAHPCEFHFHASQVRRAYLVVLLATLPGLLSRASLLSRFATPRSLLARASCDLARSAHPCEFHFHASQVRRAYLVVLLATLPGLLSRASLLSRFATPRSLLARASCDLARSAHPCEFHFHASQVRRAYLVVLLATLPGLLSRASLLSRFATPRSLLARASCDLARSAHPCEFHFHASQVRRAYLVVLLATLPGLLSRASLLSRFATPRSLLARASCDLARSAHPCEFHFHASQVRRAYLVVLLATLPGLLSRASLLSRFATPRSLLARASCDLARSAHPCEFHFHASQVRRAYLVVLLATLPGLLSRASLLSRFATTRSLLTRASCNFAGSVHPCEFTFMLHKFVEPAGSRFWRPCRVCSPVRVYFHALQVRRARWPMLLATLPGLLTRASLLSCFPSSSSLLGRASCDLAGFAHPCKFTFMPRKFAEPAGSFFLRPCRVCSPFAELARSCFLRPSRVCSPVRVSLSCFASSPSLLSRSSLDLVGSSHPCEFTFTLRNYAEPARSCFLRPCRVCSPVRVYFHASQLRGACSLVLLATLPGLLTRASLLSRFATTRSLLARASCDLAGSAHPCEFTFTLRNYAEPARSCFLRPCRVCSPVRVYFHASQLRGACSLVLLATLPGLLTRASLLSRFATTRSLLARASCDLAGSAHPCEFTFTLRNYAEPARSCFLRPCRVCSPVRVYFHASQLRGACSLVLLATLPGLLTRASLLSRFATTRSLLARASCDLAGSAHPCEFTFTLRNYAEPARSCFLRPCRVCSPVRVYFHASQLRGACSLVLLATLPGLLTRASLLSRFATTRSLLARASCDLAGSAHPCEFTFTLRNYAEPARSCFLRPCRVCSPVRVYFHASQLRGACSLVLLATLPGLLTRASLLSRFATTRSLLARASCDLAGSAHPCEFTFTLRNYAEPARSCFLRPCRVCSPVRVYFHASQLRGACSLVLLATLPGLLTRASLLSRFATTRSLLARASCDLAGSAHPCEFTFTLRNYAEPARSCFLRPCRVCSPVRVYFHASQLRGACSLVLLATLPGLLTRASLLSRFATTRSLLARASCDLAGSAHPCEFTFTLRNYAEPARSCFLRPCRVCSPVRVYFHASQLRGACSLVLLATLPGLLTRASLLSRFATTRSLLARASCDLAGSAHPCEFTFTLRNYAEPARSCFLRPCRVCSPVRVYFHASQLRGACSLVLLATLPGLLTRASLLSRFATTRSLLARASCDLAGSAHPCEFTFTLRNYAEPARSCFLRPCRVCSPVRVYFHASQLRGACSLVLLATLPGLLTRASLLSRFATTRSLLARASCDLAGSAHPCEFTFTLRNYAEPARSCFLRPCRVCSPVRVYFHASQLRGACSLVLLATLPGLLIRVSLLSCLASLPSLLARSSCDLACLLTHSSLLSCFVSSPSLLALAFCDLAGSAHPCEFTFMLRKFAEPAFSFFLRNCRVCSPMRVYFHASQLRGACSLGLLATLPGLLTHASLLSCFGSLPSLLGRASCDLAQHAHPCEFTFMLRKVAEPARSCFWQPCRVCSPVRVYFLASEVCRAFLVVLLATLPGLLSRASLLSCFPSSTSLLARASFDLAGSAHPCEFTFMLRKFVEPAGSFFMRSCRACSPVRVYFHASQDRRAGSLVLLATLPGLLTRASLLSRFATTRSLLARASFDLAGSAHPCEFTFMLRKFVKTRSLLARASCTLAESAHPGEFTFMLRKYAEPARSCYLRPCRVCSPARVYFHASQVRRNCWLVLLATLTDLLTRARSLSRFASLLTCVGLLSCFASSPSLLARGFCNHARSAHPYEFTFVPRKFAEPARSCFLQPCRVCSPVRVHFHVTLVRRACSLVLFATLPSLLTRASLPSCFASSRSLLARASFDLAGSSHPSNFTFMLRKFVETAGSFFLRPCQ